MKLVDLFCGAGGCSAGYHKAGFEVVGVDIKPQPRYPFEFYQCDALVFLEKFGYLFDVIHASPPCQRWCKTSKMHKGWKERHPDTITPTREALIKSGKPYIIENIPGSPLINPIKLCGTMFGLLTERHRLFECNPVPLFLPGPCYHWGKANPRGKISSFENGDFITVTGNNFILADAKKAMSIDWMNSREIRQSIPPAYTEWLGKEIMRLII
jgi:DNA (cytosine-5)-methyltransferase 1